MYDDPVSSCTSRLIPINGSTRTRSVNFNGIRKLTTGREEPDPYRSTPIPILFDAMELQKIARRMITVLIFMFSPFGCGLVRIILS
jgi:hypothetical protein